MKNMSNIIEEHLKLHLQKSQNGEIEVQRNELAQLFQCVPSQINYVISTRFSLEKGYIVESKRGGGGYIRIRKVQFPEKNELYFRRILELIGDEISQDSATAIVERLKEDGKVTCREAELMKAVFARELYPFSISLRDQMRAHFLKSMICVIFYEGGSAS